MECILPMRVYLIYIMNLEAEYSNRLEAIYLKELKMASGRKKNIQDHEVLNTNCTKKLNLVAE